MTFNDALEILTANAISADATPTWPAASWDAIQRAGVLTWANSSAYGGEDRDPVALLEGYARLASACLTTAFILSQREAAIRRIIDHGSPELQRELLRPLACGGRFATLGL